MRNILKFALAVVLVASLFLNILLTFGLLSNYQSGRSVGNSLAFAWSPLQQKVVNGTLWINVTWMWQTENLSMTVKVNDDDYHDSDNVGLAFDGNRNGVIEEDFRIDGGAAAFFADNKSCGGELVKGGCGIAFFSIGPSPSKYHTCTFNNQTGYQFKISFPKALFKIDHPILTHLIFIDAALSSLFEPGIYGAVVEFEV